MFSNNQNSHDLPIKNHLSNNKFLFPSGPVTKMELSKFTNIFDTLENDPLAYDFLQPVDYIGKFFLFLI